jgi:hypothetical protein
MTNFAQQYKYATKLMRKNGGSEKAASIAPKATCAQCHEDKAICMIWTGVYLCESPRVNAWLGAQGATKAACAAWWIDSIGLMITGIFSFLIGKTAQGQIRLLVMALFAIAIAFNRYLGWPVGAGVVFGTGVDVGLGVSVGYGTTIKATVANCWSL